MSLRLGLAALGVVTAQGCGKAAVAEALFSGSRAGMVARESLVPGRTIHVGAIDRLLPDVPEELELFACRNNRLAQLALNEIRDAIDEAIVRYGRHRIAVVMGTSTSGIGDGEEAFVAYVRDGRWPAGFDYRRQEPGSLSAFVARTLGLTGPAYTIATACSSSGKAMASAAQLIRAGFADAAIVGGVDSLCLTTILGFASLEALAKGLCNPFSRNRDGINIGEAAAIFLLVPDAGDVMLARRGQIFRRASRQRPRSRGEGRDVGDVGRVAASGAGAFRHRLYQSAWHGDAPERRHGKQSRACDFRRRNAVQLHQADDRPHTGRGGSLRGGVSLADAQRRLQSAIAFAAAYLGWRSGTGLASPLLDRD